MPLITAQHLTTDGSSTPASSFATASIAPTASRLILIFVSSEVAGNPNTPTVTGAGLTFTTVLSYRSVSKDTKRITILRALSQSPSTGALTIDFGGQSQSICQWSVAEFANIDTSGANGAGAIVQSAGNDNNGTSTGIAVTLASFQHPNNAVAGAAAWGNGNAISPGGAFTTLGTTFNNVRYLSEWANNNQTNVDFTWASNNDSSIAIALEIRAMSLNNTFLGGGL